MINVEHADIDARLAQQMALILVEMAERRIEIGARDHAAGIAKLRKDGAHDRRDFRIGCALAHLDEGEEMLLLLRLDPGGEAGRDLLLHILTQAK